MEVEVAPQSDLIVGLPGDQDRAQAKVVSLVREDIITWQAA